MDHSARAVCLTPLSPQIILIDPSRAFSFSIQSCLFPILVISMLCVLLPSFMVTILLMFFSPYSHF